MTKENPILEIRNIKKSFLAGKKKVDALKGVDLKVNEGEFVVIIGPSGCGKTTFLNTILGLEKPDEGQILVRGKDIYSMDEDERAFFRQETFGIVYQQSNWVKSLNVIENVAFPLSIVGVSYRKAMHKARGILYLFKFEKQEKYSPMELSGGEQQKLAVCRALVSDPSIILADEPTGNLDSVTAEDLMYDLKVLNVESKKTMIMVTHNPEYERYATKFVYMEDGVIKNVKQKEKISSNKQNITKKNINISRRSLWNKLLFLMGLALKNFKKYKTRTLLTSGGVALSIGFITFLVALSYGFQKLSTEGIEKMEVFRMLDVETGKSNITSIDEGAINKMSDIFGVEKVYPMISVAGDFDFHGKEINGVVYGRDEETLKIERPKIIAGKSFSSDTAGEVLVNSMAAKKLGIDNYRSIIGQDMEIKTIIRPELLREREDL